MRDLKAFLFRISRLSGVACVLAALFTSLLVVAQAQQPATETAPPITQPIAEPASSQASSPSNTSATTTATAVVAIPSDDRYRIGPEDVLDVRVFNRPQLSRDAVRVDNRGMIRMPMIEGEIKAACKTEGELAEEIAAGYKKYLRNPQVDVFIKEFQSQPVAVMGAVNKAGQFRLQRRVRLLELLSFAGGPSEDAGGTVQIVHEAKSSVCDSLAQSNGPDDEPGMKLVSYALSDTTRGDEKANPFVQPGDIITIPEAEKAFVVGNVLRPGVVSLKDKPTISQAIAEAGGLMPDSKSDRIIISRQVPGNPNTEIAVNLKKIKARLEDDVALQAGDIVDVPVAGGKRLIRTLFSSVIPAVGQLPVQVIR